MHSHNWLRSKNQRYYEWHLNPYATLIHRAVALLAIGTLLLNLGIVLFAYPSTSHAAILTIQPGSATGKDTWLEYLSSNTHGNESTVQVYASGGAGGYFGLVQFPLDDIPAGATINSATITVFGEYWIPGPNSIRLHRVTSSWDEATTSWDTMPAIDSSSTYQTDVVVSGATLNFDVTALVRDWSSGTINNYGVRFGYTSFSSVQAYNFTSSEGSIATNRPKLVVDYTASSDGNTGGGNTGGEGGTSDPTPTPSPSPSPSVVSNGGGSAATTPSPSEASTKPSPSPKKVKTIKEELLSSPSPSPEVSPEASPLTPTPSPTPPPTTKPAVEIITTKRTYAENEEIVGYVMVANGTDKTVELRFPTSEQADYMISGPSNYQWAKGRLFGPRDTIVRIAPGHRHGWRFVHTAKRASLKQGSYTLRGEVKGVGTASKEVSIQ